MNLGWDQRWDVTKGGAKIRIRRPDRYSQGLKVKTQGGHIAGEEGQDIQERGQRFCLVGERGAPAPQVTKIIAQGHKTHSMGQAPF